MKAVLVIDMPKRCAECELCTWGGTFEGIRMNICSRTGKMGKQEKLDGCPLRPLPERMTADLYYRKTPYICNWKERSYGWNECLAEILGETE